MPDIGTGISTGLGVLGLNESKKQGEASQQLQAEQLALERERDEFNRGQVEQMNEWATEDRDDFMTRRDRSRGIYDPLEMRQAGMQGSLYDLAEKGPDYAGAAARSDADVAQTFGVQREQERRRQQRFGVNPASGRMSAEERRMGNTEALAKVYGRNRSRMQEDDKDWSRRMAAMGTGNYTNPAMRGSSGNTNLAQLGVSGASGVLGNMSSAAGANAQGAAQFTGKMIADGLDYYNKSQQTPSPTGGVTMPIEAGNDQYN